MESSAMTTYKDTTPAARLDNKTLNKMVWRSMQLQAAFQLRTYAISWMVVGYLTRFTENPYK